MSVETTFSTQILIIYFQDAVFDSTLSSREAVPTPVAALQANAHGREKMARFRQHPELKGSGPPPQQPVPDVKAQDPL